MQKARILLSVMIMLIIATGTVFASGATQDAAASQSAAAAAPTTSGLLPRNETLYFNGLQWGSINGWNPYMGTPNNAFAVSAHRQLVFETLFMYNLLDNQLYPQIGETRSWSGQNLTVTISQHARWADGTAITAEDVVYSFKLAQKYSIGASQYWEFLNDVVATGPLTVVFQGKAPPNFNLRQIERAISEHVITPKAFWEAAIADGRLGSGEGALAAYNGSGIRGSGPYQRMHDDATMVILQRNDAYWGQHASRRGKLPVPKYIAHNIFADNPSGDVAFRAGQVDVSQQFVAQIWTYFNDRVSTYLPAAPYYLPGYIPSIFFNTQKPGLNDPVVRRAIAMVIDYDRIANTAMSGYSAPKEPHIMLPGAEQNLINVQQLQQYYPAKGDVAGANASLDQAGWVRGSDGIRAKGGVRLSFRIQCPDGWTDWNASLEIVASSARQIGIDIQTYFTTQTVWNNDMQSGNFDIIMNNTSAPGAASPWSRAYNMLSSTFLPTTAGVPNTIGNWGRWHNAEVNQIINQITNETNEATLRQLWTQLNTIFLQEMPVIGLMYRPWLFHQVNESVWTGFPKAGDGTNIPPTILLDGYGILGLYNLRLR